MERLERRSEPGTAGIGAGSWDCTRSGRPFLMWVVPEVGAGDVSKVSGRGERTGVNDSIGGGVSSSIFGRLGSDKALSWAPLLPLV